MKIFKYIALVVPICALMSACNDDTESVMKNDLIKKTVSPAIVGEQLEFAYAMGTLNGTLGSASVTASVPGATGTGFGVYSYYTARTTTVVSGVSYAAGTDVPLKTVTEVSTSGAVSTAKMDSQVDEVYVHPQVPYGTSKVNLDAATIRYYYVVPEEARGKEVSFSFSSQSTSGDVATYSTPSYKVSKMDMKRMIVLTNLQKCYFSIADMAVYTQAEVNAQNLSGKIDFVYDYKDKVNGFTYGHSFVSPGSDPKYFGDPLVVDSWTKNKTLMEKRVDVRDAQLKGSIPNVYIDDIDFQTLKIDDAADFVLNFAKDEGAFMKTADGKYAAYVYVNSVGTGTVTVSIKRYPLK